MNQAYLDTVRLLLSVAPVIFKNPGFALKGGTAINLFLRDMPRLSVDLDLVFPDHQPGRDEALRSISNLLGGIEDELSGLGFSCETGSSSQGDEVKLFVAKDRTRIKVEVNHVFRGTVLPVQASPLASEAQDIFFTDIELPVLHPNELYGSKLVAAMDRQHPRDLFDILQLYEHGGLTDGIIECFVCYLAGHNRPVHEVLFANKTDITAAFANEFEGMTKEPVTLNELLQVRDELFANLPASLSDDQHEFLTGLVEGNPDWSLMACEHLAAMPAIRWKLTNLERLQRTNPDKFALQTTELKKRFR
jgi:hypothetical protein